MSQAPVTANVVTFPAANSNGEPLRVEVIQRGFFGRWSAWIAWAVAGFMFLAMIGMTAAYKNYITPNPHISEQLYRMSGSTPAEQAQAAKKIAVINVNGAIMHHDGFAKWQIDQVRDDEDVAAIVVRINSPGGTVTGSHYLWHQLKQLRTEKEIPLVVSMGEMAASGGYYIAMAVDPKLEDTIWAESTTWTGSIGVIIPHYDVSGLMKDWNIKEDSIASHRLKGSGSPTRAMTEEERKLFQELVDESFTKFKGIVQQGRPKMTAAEIDAVATGQIFTAEQAQKSKLVDQIGFLEDAIRHAAKLAGLTDAKSYRAVSYKRQQALFPAELFGGGDIGADGSLPAARSSTELVGKYLQQLMQPRAMYIWPAVLPAVE